MDSETIESYKIDLINQINKYRNNHGSKKSINYPQNNKNITKITFKNQKILLLI